MLNYVQELFVVGHDILVGEGSSLDDALEVLGWDPVEVDQGLTSEEVVLLLFGDNFLQFAEGFGVQLSHKIFELVGGSFDLLGAGGPVGELGQVYQSVLEFLIYLMHLFSLLLICSFYLPFGYGCS